MDDNYHSRLSRFLEIAKRLQSAGVPHFTRTVTQNRLEIPASFVRDHGENMKPLASLRLASGSKVWRLQIQVSYSGRFRVRFCELWMEFLSDNDLKQGDELIVSLVAMSEFVIYKLKWSLDSRKLSRNPEFNEPTSPPSGDELPDANTPKSTLRTTPLNPSRPGMKVEMQKGNISDNFCASPVTLDRDKFKNQIAETERRAEIPDNSFSGTIFFQKRMSAACIGYYGKSQYARIEIPGGFVRRHRRLLSEGTLITLEGPMPGTISQVVCRHNPINRRVVWRRGWPSFVRRNELRTGAILAFRLIAPNRFSVHLRNSLIQDPSFTKRNADVSRKDRGSTAQGVKISNAQPTNRTNRSATVDPYEHPYFFKTVPVTSVPKLTAYPFLVVPTAFQLIVTLPPQVNLLGPNSDEIFPVKYSGEAGAGTSKNLARGWKHFADSNALEAGDKLRFNYMSALHLFVVEYV